MGYEDEEASGRCAAIMTTGKRCPNASLPGSRYCGLPAHQALEGTETDEVAELAGEDNGEPIADGDGDGAIEAPVPGEAAGEPDAPAEAPLEERTP